MLSISMMLPDNFELITSYYVKQIISDFTLDYTFTLKFEPETLAQPNSTI
jgi:hypothetical protein